MIQLAWRFLLFQKDSALAQWFRTRTEGASGARKTKMIVALARNLLIALWRMVTTGCRATIKVRIPDNQDEKVLGAWLKGGRSPTGGPRSQKKSACGLSRGQWFVW
jgi:hypothetical protein